MSSNDEHSHKLPPNSPVVPESALRRLPVPEHISDRESLILEPQSEPPPYDATQQELLEPVRLLPRPSPMYRDLNERKVQPLRLSEAPELPPPINKYSLYSPNRSTNQLPTLVPSPCFGAGLSRPLNSSYSPGSYAEFGDSAERCARSASPTRRRPLPSAPSSPLFDSPTPPQHLSPRLNLSKPTAIDFSPRSSVTFGDASSVTSTSIKKSLSEIESIPEKEFIAELSLDDDASSLKKHYGPAPEDKQPRRLRNIRKRQVSLTEGNLVLDCPIPRKLSSFLRYRDENEFGSTRYTAATCDADEFPKRGFCLRQNLLERDTELFVTITMYNEDERLLTRTLHGVMKNVAHLCSRNKSRVWGKDGWKKVVVCIIADGRKKTNSKVLDVLAALGVYQEGIAKNEVNGKQVQAHIFEYTTQMCIDPDLRFCGPEKGIVPVQLIFCMKEHNQKKINSHRWFFNAFSPLVNPNICVLLDVGTRPSSDSLYHLWKAFDRNSNVAGACGEIMVMKGKGWRDLLLNPLVAAQNFEYKISNILDKPFESIFGFISVLPGAFSAYRYIALKEHEDGTGPLTSYFKAEEMGGKETDVFSANMYLAEDRILCWELIAKRGSKWILRYVREAKGETDVPESVPELMSQRRRWLNGSLFAAIYAQCHILQIRKTDHSVLRRIFLYVEFLYQFLNLLISFFALSFFFLITFFLSQSIARPQVDPFKGYGYHLFTFFRYLCLLLICVQFLLSMGNRPQGAKKMFITSLILFMIIMIYSVFCALYLAAQILQRAAHSPRDFLGHEALTNVIVALISTYGSYYIASLIYFDPWHMLTSFIQYLLLLPFYICTMQIYAFCNTHDVTWGTKGENKINTDLGCAVVTGSGVVEVDMPAEQVDIDDAYSDALLNLRDAKPAEKCVAAQYTTEDYYREVRTKIVCVWLISNAVVGMAVSEVYHTAVKNNYFMIVLTWTVATMSFLRLFGSLLFVINENVQRLMNW